MEILVLFACVLALVLLDIPIAVSLGIVAVVAASLRERRPGAVEVTGGASH